MAEADLEDVEARFFLQDKLCQLGLVEVSFASSAKLLRLALPAYTSC